jgi:hypothetical protein
MNVSQSITPQGEKLTNMKLKKKPMDFNRLEKK